jgi:tetratricopeptide (TPR) repeat protein
VYAERQASDEWGRETQLPFVQAMLDDRILSLEDLNSGFTDPELISLAYYQASLVVEHIVEAYGQSALDALLRAYGAGAEGEEAIEQGLGVSLDELQRGFDAMLEGRFGPLMLALAPVEGVQQALEDVERAAELADEHPESYLAQLAYGRALRQDGRLDEAVAVLERAASLVPMASGQGSARAQLAQIAMEQEDAERAAKELEALIRNDHTNVSVARALLDLLNRDSNPSPARLRVAYERIVEIDPFDAEAHAALGRLLLEGRETERAIRELRAALAAGPTDRAAVHVDLAEAYLTSGERTLARRQTLAALEIAPSYDRAQELLLAIVESP